MKKKCLNCNSEIHRYKYYCDSNCETIHTDNMNKGLVDIFGKKVVKEEEELVYN